MVHEFLDLGKWFDQTLPIRKMQFQITLASLQFCPDYWIRHLPPAQTDTFSLEIDSLVLRMVEKSSGIDFAAESDITRTRLRLPFWQSGLGFREA